MMAEIFSGQYTMSNMKADESVIDFPKEQLCPEVWTQIVGSDGGTMEWGLTDEARVKIFYVIEYISRCIKDTENYTYGLGAHITGSITSNCYTENADVDLHFYCTDPEAKIDADKLTEAVRAHFEENLKDEDLDKAYIGKHPIEVYFQGNIFQDLMSVGCYDVIKERWLVGPDFTSQEFNPYSEYYKDIKKTAKNLISSMRSSILAAYESAVVFKKVADNTQENQDVQQYQELRKELQENLKKAVALFVKARKSRRTLSEPHSKEEALKYRKSREWHLSDATFKLLDKFGYLGILKGFTECYQLFVQEEPEVDISIAERVISLVKDKIGNEKTLADAEDDEQIDEGAKEVLTMMTLVSMLAIKGILPAATLERNLREVPRTEMRASSKAFKAAIAKSTVGQKVNGLNQTNLVNALARTIFAEAKSEGPEGQSAVASVIWNRAGGKSKNMISVISKPLHFSCWNAYKGGWTDANYTLHIPPDARDTEENKQIWKNCVQLATKLATEEFTSTIGNRNSYMNMKKADKKNIDSWGKQLDLTIKNQKYGYLRNNDGFRKEAKKAAKKPSVYVVKKGDTLAAIAKTYKTTVEELQKKNNISNPDKISIGQKIVV